MDLRFKGSSRYIAVPHQWHSGNISQRASRHSGASVSVPAARPAQMPSCPGMATPHNAASAAGSGTIQAQKAHILRQNPKLLPRALLVVRLRPVCLIYSKRFVALVCKLKKAAIPSDLSLWLSKKYPEKCKKAFTMALGRRLGTKFVKHFSLI